MAQTLASFGSRPAPLLNGNHDTSATSRSSVTVSAKLALSSPSLGSSSEEFSNIQEDDEDPSFYSCSASSSSTSNHLRASAVASSSSSIITRQEEDSSEEEDCTMGRSAAQLHMSSSAARVSFSSGSDDTWSQDHASWVSWLTILVRQLRSGRGQMRHVHLRTERGSYADCSQSALTLHSLLCYEMSFR